VQLLLTRHVQPSHTCSQSKPPTNNHVTCVTHPMYDIDMIHNPPQNPPSPRNNYGSHPMYVDLNTQTGNTHVVYMRNSNGRWRVFFWLFHSHGMYLRSLLQTKLARFRVIGFRLWIESANLFRIFCIIFSIPHCKSNTNS
jgi:hypothetical protein